jgi:endonuclease G
MTKRKNTKKRKNAKIKLPFGVIITLIIIALIVIGCLVYLYPDETRTILQTLYEKISGKPTRPASPLPSTNGSDNLAFGIPGPADTIIDREGYALGYIEYHEQPAWVIYHMTYDEATTKVTSRNDNFREDPEIPSGSATLADYRGSGYDRGHLAPAADMAFSIKTMDESFYMSNMSPQKGEFNRGIWKDLEAQVRSFAISEKGIFVVTGPILPKTKTITIGANKVTVPDVYYKVVYDRTPPEKMIGFILPNAGSSKQLQDFAVTVDAVEAATGLDFFNLLPQPQQEQLESSIDINAWNWQ